MAEVIFQQVEKVYPGNIPAVLDFSLSVRDKEFLILVGPSGCGKSTVLRMVAGLEEITRGQIRIDGRVMNDVPPRDRDIAMVFQNYALYPHMTVFENMAFGLQLRHFRKAEIQKRVTDAAAVLGIQDVLHRRPKALSGGQRQRVALGRAIVRQPAVFLFDEPLSNLDAKMRVQMRLEINRLHARLGVTMIYVTHDQTEAMTMGDTIVVMDKGVVQQAADPVRLYSEPANRFVAGFIGTPPMNFFEGGIRRGSNGALTFEETDGGFSIPVPVDFAAALGGLQDRPVTLGIRPEDIGSAAAAAMEDAPRIEATVDVIEPMGAETFVHFNTGRHPLVSRVDSQRRFRVGEKVMVPVLAGKVHFFETETGRRISRQNTSNQR